MNFSIKSIVFYDSLVAISWVGGASDYIDLSFLRNACPCAFCSGEKDVFGARYIGEKKTLPNKAFIIIKYSFVGLYGVRFFWKDGHRDGIYTLKLLKSLNLP